MTFEGHYWLEIRVLDEKGDYVDIQEHDGEFEEVSADAEDD